MSLKMLAGLVAGGFGAALSIGLVLSSLSFPVLAAYLALALLFGLGLFSGVLAARWLDLADYGHQPSAGAFVGLVAAGVTEVIDLILRLVFAAINKASPTTVLSNFIVSRLPVSTQVAHIILLIIVNLILYLIYLLIVVAISSSVTSVVGRAKTAQALQTMLDAREQALLPDADDAPEMDPALLPFMRPEYSPFVSEAPPPPVSPWQQRRLEREGQPFDKGRQLNPRRSQPGGTNPPGAPARGMTPGSAQPRPMSRLRPPPNTPRPRPRGKD
ncbi:MAG TPA: hypothetical protein VH599_13555 [Ktedonobacterales bacterium]|jgi:hypothetical protein